MYVITRKGKHCLITDHTCVCKPELGLNALIDKNNRAVPLCNLQQFRYNLRNAKRHAHGRDILIFKSDIKGAYRLIPMHPFWQMFQATKLADNTFVINRNNVFGGGTSG